MTVTQEQLKSMFSLKRVIIPILLGIGVSVISLFSTHFDFSSLSGAKFTFYYIFLAILLMMIRDLAYIWRLRVLTEKKMKLKDIFHVVFLWEFASSVTPSMVGGSAFAIFFINAERVPLGKSTAIVMITALLDELFYIIMVAIVLCIVSHSLFDITIPLVGSPMPFFVAGYIFIIILTLSIVVGIFIAPQGLKKILASIFSLSFLKKWKTKAIKTGDEIIITSTEMKGKPKSYWLKAFTATAFSWTARFGVLNCLILAANPDKNFHFGEQLLIYAKQLIMWVILLISPTPGASGIAEGTFPAFFGDYFTDNMQNAVAVLWRCISYYPYLILGLIILPIWLRKLEKRRILTQKHAENTNQTEC